jgi:pimeloyl-ACP methyl ester carboxylesterase
LIIAIISIASLSYLAGVAYLYFFQDHLIFRPDLAPKEVKLPREAKRLFIDGIETGVIDKQSDTTLFYFGGNANNALEFLHLAKDFGVNIVAMNYPGYGNSKGKPSQKSLFEAALKVFDRFKNDRNILLGRSLGTAVAAYVASKRKADKVILITPYHSITHLAKLRYPIFPVKLLVRHPFETWRYIQKVDAPVYVMLAERDETTPLATFKKLRPYIKNLREVVTIPKSDHGNILEFEEVRKILKRWIEGNYPSVPGSTSTSSPSSFASTPSTGV